MSEFLRFFLLFLKFTDFTDQLLIEHFLCTRTYSIHTHVYMFSKYNTQTSHSTIIHILCTTFRLSTLCTPHIIHTNSYTSRTYSLRPYSVVQAPYPAAHPTTPRKQRCGRPYIGRSSIVVSAKPAGSLVYINGSDRSNIVCAHSTMVIL